MAPVPRHLRVIAPELFASSGVQRIDDAPGTRDVHAAIDDDRRCLHAAPCRHVEIPGESQSVDILLVDLCQRTEALLVIGAPMRQPVGRVGISSNQALGGDRR